MNERERKEKFTPGPWHILVPKPRYGNLECHSIVDGGGEYVAKTVVVSVLRGISAVKREERKANEHLIAAAPEMYDTLAGCESSLDIVLKDEIIPEYIKEIVQDIILTISHTLKKARGEE